MRLMVRHSMQRQLPALRQLRSEATGVEIRMQVAGDMLGRYLQQLAVARDARNNFV